MGPGLDIRSSRGLRSNIELYTYQTKEKILHQREKSLMNNIHEN